MAFEYHYQRRVEFADTDTAGIIHFANYFRYMEEAEHAFFRSIGFSVIHEHEGTTYSWPRLSCQCDIFRPVRFEDELDVHLRITRIGTKSVTLNCRFSHQSQKVAQGKMIIACCIMHPGEGLEGVPIPDHLRKHLELSPDMSIE
jgi:YbgC/YbaW family acyl-CoA thioester hydrolase